MSSVSGKESVERLGEALTERLGTAAIHWVGSPPGMGIDAVGWKLSAAPRFLFSVSTQAGQLPMGRYDLQMSVADQSLENGDIVFLGELGVEAACALAERFARGEVVRQVNW